MNYLGLDLGSKTVGVSNSTSGIIANNLTTIRFTENNYDEASLEVIKLVKSNKIDVLVIGVPRHMNHDLGIRGQISVDFKEKLLESIEIEIVLWDERMTTQIALKTLSSGKTKYQKQRKLKDELAATLILQNYLDFINNK
ncbi:MAG: Holliday junction resolvase RuvX [Acholeplasmataceae bacterium]|nr:Holliday junction resolvase RuvX [Acholeplasmataceae bacterium]